MFLKRLESPGRILSEISECNTQADCEKGHETALGGNRPEEYAAEGSLKLNLVRPHLLQAYANVEELAGHLEERNDLRTALRESGHGLVALDAAGRVAHATPGVAECLARYFPDAAPFPRIPTALEDWRATHPTSAFTMHGTGATLVVRNPRDAQHLLLVSEDHGLPTLSEGGPLTPRESEVLHWLGEGKSNREIAGILGISAGTAKQHVQSILAKLGVANRTVATAVARRRRVV